MNHNLIRCSDKHVCNLVLLVSLCNMLLTVLSVFMLSELISFGTTLCAINLHKYNKKVSADNSGTNSK